MLVRNELTTIDRLLFGDDPRSLELGGEHKVLSYLRAWRPLFTYVCTTQYEFHNFKNTNTTLQKEVLPQLEWLGVYLPGIFGNNFRKVRQWKIVSGSLVVEERSLTIRKVFRRSDQDVSAE